MSRPLFRRMIHHLQIQYPKEGCGLLAGHTGQATQIYPVDNILKSPNAYEMEPLQQIRAMLIMEEHGDELVAIYHSHPQGPSTPSETDVAQAYYPDAVYLIVSLYNFDEPEVRGFRIVDGRVTEVLIIVE
ncbi:MAG: M67 family metallopeptidase [Chloroflexi bacterium]|nr:M67 family metallopeptidase [Chloroflexota bacterium]